MSNLKTSLPVTRIRPSGSWLSVDLRELWNYRELLFFLTWRDVKVRYKQTVIGVFWAVLQPVATTAIFAVVFSQVANFSSPGVPYPVYVLSGLLIWLFINNSVVFASNSLVGSSDLVTKAYFPRLIMPLAAVGAGLIDLAVGLVVLLVVLIFYGGTLSSQLLFMPLFLGLAIVLTLSIGTLASALNVRFRDVKFALPFGLQIWMFASPIFYPLEILSERARIVIDLNPLTGILTGFRSSLFGQPINWRSVGIGSLVTVVLALGSIIVFKRMEDDFADMI